LSEEKKESEVEAKSTEDSSSENTTADETAKLEAKAAEEAKLSESAIAKAEAAAKAVEDAEIAVKEALLKAEAAKAEAEAAAEEEYKAIAAEVKAEAAAKLDYTFKRQGEEIFRRDMGEPEFWLEKEDRFPRPILSADEQESLTRIAEIPQDQTPAYVPEHVLSPEFSGVSNYERGVDSFLEEMKQKLKQLKSNPEATEKEIKETENKIIYLESLHENFYIGMNVFRTAKGGRDKIKA
jgi:colicin import membrane protein